MTKIPIQNLPETSNLLGEKPNQTANTFYQKR